MDRLDRCQNEDTEMMSVSQMAWLLLIFMLLEVSRDVRGTHSPVSWQGLVAAVITVTALVLFANTMCESCQC